MQRMRSSRTSLICSQCCALHCIALRRSYGGTMTNQRWSSSRSHSHRIAAGSTGASSRPFLLRFDKSDRQTPVDGTNATDKDESGQRQGASQPAEDPLQCAGRSDRQRAGGGKRQQLTQRHIRHGSPITHDGRAPAAVDDQQRSESNSSLIHQLEMSGASSSNSGVSNCLPAHSGRGAIRLGGGARLAGREHRGPVDLSFARGRILHPDRFANPRIFQPYFAGSYRRQVGSGASPAPCSESLPLCASPSARSPTATPAEELGDCKPPSSSDPLVVRERPEPRAEASGAQR